MRRRHDPRRTDAGRCSPAVIPISVVRGSGSARLLLVNTVSPGFVIADPSVLRESELHPVEIQLPRGQNQEQCKKTLREDVEDTIEY